MVALLNPIDGPVPGMVQRRRVASAGGLRTAATARPRANRSHLRLVESPPRESRLHGVPVAGTAVAVAVVFGLLLAVRLSQGAPPATSWAELQGDPRGTALALAGPGDQLRVVEPGDTMWAIALEVAPDRDPRLIVDRLTEANGGSSALTPGQQLVIPAEVVAGG